MKNHKDILGKIPGGLVLDVAAGHGRSTLALMQNLEGFKQVTAIDTVDFTDGSTQEVLKHEKVTFVQMDARCMDFADNTFDTVHIAHSLHHLEEVEPVLQEMVRVLKPGGHLIVDEMYRDQQTEKQLNVVHLHDWWADIDTRLGILHNHTYCRQEIIALIDQLDLKLTDFTDIIDSSYTESELIHIGEKGIEQYYQRAQDLPDFKEFSIRGEQLRQQLHTIGAQLATTLLTVGIK
jgi:ubiquinone/menaquinone biosynthesis C-methylase UbiE